MNILSDWFESFKQTLRENPRKILFSFIFLLVLLISLLLVMLLGRTSIRQSQLESLVYPKITSKQLIPLNYNQEEKKIAEAEAVSILFGIPSNSDYQAMLKIVKKKEKELNRSIYVYPLVYQVDKIAQKYQINPTETTFVFYEEGVEKNRFTFESVEEPERNFIPELNRLPMWNIKVIEPDESTEEATKESNEG